MNFRAFPTLFLSFLKKKKKKKKKAMFVLGEISGTCFTIFLILFNRFPLSVMSYFPICINISSSLFFRRLPNFYITFLLVPTRKLVSKKLSFLLKIFLISVSAQNHQRPGYFFYGFASSSFPSSVSIMIFWFIFFFVMYAFIFFFSEKICYSIFLN